MSSSGKPATASCEAMNTRTSRNHSESSHAEHDFATYSSGKICCLTSTKLSAMMAGSGVPIHQRSSSLISGSV
eukprot:7297-Heterococcus_DN1.PRE.1